MGNKRWLNTLGALALLLAAGAHAQIEVITAPGDSLFNLLRAHGAEGSFEELQPLVRQTVRDNPHAFRNRDPNRLIPDELIVLPIARAPEPEPEPPPAPPPGPPTIGELAVTKGIARHDSLGTSSTVSARAPLYSGDAIDTAAGARATLTFDDGSRVELGPSTRFVVQEFQKPTADNPGSALLNLLYGAVRAVTGVIGERLGSTYRLQTTAATIGIRGTDYVARFCTEQCGDLGGASVAVADGGVVLRNAGGEVGLDKGEFARAESADASPKIEPLPEGFFDLDRRIDQIEVHKTWFEELLDGMRSLFE